MPDGPRRIAVMQLVYSLRMGGSERVAMDISTHLNREHFHPHMCAMDLDGELAGELDRGGIPHCVLHRKGMEAGIFRRLYTTIRQRRIDVVHTHHFTQLFFAAVPARLAGARIVHTEHEFFSYVGSSHTRRLIRPLSRLADSMTVVGPEVADYFVRTIGIPAERVTVVPNGVDIESLQYDRAAARVELGIEPGDFVIGTVGRLEPEKNQQLLLDVFARFRSAHPAARLLVAGDGSMAGELRAHAARAGIADRTSFLGYRRDIARLLAAMDAFVLTSVREGLPISLIEAMAAGRPVVASGIGSVNHLVRDSENGLVVPSTDADAFTRAIERLSGSPQLRERLAAAGRQTVEESFSLAAVVRAYEALYRSAAANRHVRN